MEFWRFIFTILIVLCHCLEFPEKQIQGTTAFWGGYIGVEFFFLVSGFLMAMTIAKKAGEASRPLGIETAQFLLHKVKKVFPHYLFCFILIFVIAQIITKASALQVWQEAARSVYNIFLLSLVTAPGSGFYLSGSWYLSAMLIAMLILYPMARKSAALFNNVIAPIIIILFIGFAYQYRHTLNMHTAWERLCYDGVYRALGEISLGCICFAVCEKLRQVRFTVPGKIMLGVLEAGGYIGVIVAAYFSRYIWDFQLLLLLCLCIIISFSERSCLYPLLNRRASLYCGALSIDIYLSHMFVIRTIMPLFSGLGYWEKVLICVLMSISFGLFCRCGVWALQRLWKKCGSAIKGVFIEGA